MGENITTLKGVFIFSATIIGAGILALPLKAATSGFLPLLLILLIVGVISIYSALYISETVLVTKGDHHLPSLAKKYLGNWGMLAMILGIMVYIYGALIGYLSAGGRLFNTLSGGVLPNWAGVLIYFFIASIIIVFGLRLLSYVESYLFYLMLLLLGLVISFSFRSIQVPMLLEANWSQTLGIFGVVLFAYVGHSVIPSIASGLRVKKDINKVAVIGVLLPLILYVIWSLVIIGIVPAASLSSASQSGNPATIPLGVLVGGSIFLLGNIFAVLSTMTSYIGFGFSLKDAYINTSSLYHRRLKPYLATLLVVIPPLIIALRNPAGFVNALDIAGTYGGGLFVGILPVLMVLKARQKNIRTTFITKGGTVVPLIVLAIYLAGMIYTTLQFF
ncbi:amino acid permease [Candidatus Woesearchaeota archaeon]|nr:amino acid permease [Candidatus Woesearchaeota archaeon]